MRRRENTRGVAAWGIEWEPRVRPKVALVLPQGHAAEATRDQVVVGVVPGVLDGHILEQTTLHPKDVVHPEPYLISTTDLSPRTSISHPRELVRVEVLHHILQALRHHRFCDLPCSVCCHP